MTKKKSRNYPYASVGRGRLEINAVACDLLGDIGQYRFAKFLATTENNRPIVIVEFLEEFEVGAIPVKHKQQKGKPIKGMVIAHKDLMTELFGFKGCFDGTERLDVDIVGGNRLIIFNL